MAAPIEELLISVEIEQGSKMEELHQMLKDLKDSGGKIEVEIPVEKFEQLGNKITSINRRVGELANVLKPLIVKFPNMIEEVKGLASSVLEELTEFVKSYNTFSENLKRQLSEKLTSIINNVLEIQSAISKTTIIKGIDDEITNKLDSFYQNVVDLVNQMVIKLEEVSRKVSANTGYVTRKGNETIKAVVDEIQKLKSSPSFEDISKILDRLTEIHSNVLDLSTEIDNIKELLSVNNLPNLDQITTDITELLNDFIKPLFESVEDRLTQMYGDIFNIPREQRGELEKLREEFSELKENIEKIATETNLNFWGTFDAVKQIRDRINKIKSKDPEALKAIDDLFKNGLKEFKDKLDNNLRGIIEPELNTFLDSITAVLGKEEINLPGIKELGERGATEDISGFWRRILSLLLQQTVDQIKGNINAYLQSDLQRRIEEMTPKQVKDVGETFGIELKKSDAPKEFLEKVLEAVRPYTVKELISGMFKETSEEKIQLPTEDLLNETIDSLKQSSIDSGNLKGMIEVTNTKLEKMDRWLQSLEYSRFLPMHNLLKSIDDKIAEITPMETIDNSDKNKKGENK